MFLCCALAFQAWVIASGAIWLHAASSMSFSETRGRPRREFSRDHLSCFDAAIDRLALRASEFAPPPPPRLSYTQARGSDRHQTSRSDPCPLRRPSSKSRLEVKDIHVVSVVRHVVVRGLGRVRSPTCATEEKSLDARRQAVPLPVALANPSVAFLQI